MRCHRRVACPPGEGAGAGAGAGAGEGEGEGEGEGPPARRGVAAVEERRCDALLEALHHAPAEGGRREWG